ncbi:MAG: hypothetical protein SWE60_01825 [Thermodesulfobacteriota bacterium]|nr:hypothetical protein [Thermodesulfobacteriota bacterium]
MDIILHLQVDAPAKSVWNAVTRAIQDLFPLMDCSMRLRAKIAYGTRDQKVSVTIFELEPNRRLHKRYPSLLFS